MHCLLVGLLAVIALGAVAEQRGKAQESHVTRDCGTEGGGCRASRW